MIEVDGQSYPLRKAMFQWNSAYISPWTGLVWGRIDRGYKEYVARTWPAPGEQPWPLRESVSGSLYSCYEIRMDMALAELPRELIDRELAVLKDSTSAIIPRYNVALDQKEIEAMNQIVERIALLRSKIASGVKMEDGELREAYALLRQERMSAATKAATTKKSSPAVTMTPEEAIKSLFG